MNTFSSSFYRVACRCFGCACLAGTLALGSLTARAQLADFVTSGLWMGDVTLFSVSYPRTATVESTLSRAQMRMLLHVDATGKVRLLKEVILARKSGSVSEVLLFTEPARMAGKPVARDTTSSALAQRYSTAAYDFKDTDGTLDSALLLTGSLARGQKLEGTLVLDKLHSSNPFRHKFHPEHANDGAAAYQITRKIKIDVNSAALSINGAPQFTLPYEETIQGLHRADLVVQGQVVLTRVSTVDSLNP